MTECAILVGDCSAVNGNAFDDPLFEEDGERGGRRGGFLGLSVILFC